MVVRTTSTKVPMWRKAGGAVAGLEQHMALGRRFAAEPRQELASLLEGPGLGLSRQRRVSADIISFDIFSGQEKAITRVRAIARQSRTSLYSASYGERKRTPKAKEEKEEERQKRCGREAEEGETGRQ